MLQGLADARNRFIAIDVGAYGKQSDGGIFLHSSPYQFLSSNNVNTPSAMKLQGGAKRTHVFEMGISRESSFLWGYLKSKVYVRKPRTVDDLKVSIREEIATVAQEMLVNVMQNFEERLRTCVRQEGRHLSDIIFDN